MKLHINYPPNEHDSRFHVSIDISGPLSLSNEDSNKLSDAIRELPGKVKIRIRIYDKAAIPDCLKQWTIENKYLMKAITIIDKTIIWYGAPSSAECFRQREKRFKPVTGHLSDISDQIQQNRYTVFGK